MSLLLCWLLFPAVIAVLSLGCGAVLEALARVRLPGALLVPAGLAVIVVVAQLATVTEATAPFATPSVVGLAIVGLALYQPWRRGPLDIWAVVSGAAVFAAFAAPIVLSGHATFGGYIKLDDTSTWLALTDRVIEHGRDVSSLAPSTYEATVELNLAHGYPVGSFLPLGVGGQVFPVDLAWLFQPYLAFLGAVMALALYVVLAPMIASRPARAVTVFVGSQPALLFGYYIWGGIKEMAAAWALALIAAFVPASIRAGSLRALLPVAVAGAAILSILSYGGGVWLVPLLLPALAAAVRLWGLGRAARLALGFLLVGGLLSLPSLIASGEFLGQAGAETLSKAGDLGNLIQPLSWLQFFGVWPVGDFRLRPSDMTTTHVLVIAVIAAGLVGLYWAWRRGAWELLAFVGSTTIGAAALAGVGSPWVDAKALATASPAFLVAAMAGAAAMFEVGRRVEAVVIAAAIAGGVLWSNALAYHDMNLAPRDRLVELEHIGDRYEGQGPTLMTDYEPYGVRHFLRREDAEGASELRRRLIPLRSGRSLDKLEFADIDQFQLDGLFVYRTMVLRRSPVGSRPPSVYRLVERKRYYEVWQRPEGPVTGIAEHFPLGNEVAPGAVPRCADVRRLASVAGPGGLLATVDRPAVTKIDLSATVHPPSWQTSANDPSLISPSSGRLDTDFLLRGGGPYEIWLRGLFKRRLEVLIDGRRVASGRHELAHFGTYLPLGSAVLTRGQHHLTLEYGEEDLRPGSGGPPYPIGPLAIARDTTNNTVRYVPVKKAQSLCGKRLDWIEAIRA